MYGLLFSDDLNGYDFWGWLDPDIMIGNIRKFINDGVLNKYDILSTDENLTWGEHAEAQGLDTFALNDSARFVRLVVYDHIKHSDGDPDFRLYDSHIGMDGFLRDHRYVPEIKLEMVDSASDTGSGIDIKVETLGTDVPFKFVKKMVFLYKIPEAKQEWLRKTYPDIGFESFNPANGDILEYEEKSTT